MLNKLLRWYRAYGRRLLTLPEELAATKMLMGKVLANQIAARGLLEDIREAEFKVFSQFGEDGILQYLVRETRLPRALWTFVEFGVESYQEANTRFLLLNDGWRGLVMDGSPSNIAKIKQSPTYWRHDLNAVAAFVDADNINRLISEGGYRGEVGILSVDIDGNDYWVWERIDVVNPIIVVAEYNSVFGARRAVTIPYDPRFVRGDAHYSHLYWGCSLKALELLGKRKGYVLVGSNSAGNNAFFVRQDCMLELKAVDAEKAYVESRFRESRDVRGRLTYLTGKSRLHEIRELPIYDVEQNALKQLDELLE
jgi:hypothetical protein